MYDNHYINLQILKPDIMSMSDVMYPYVSKQNKQINKTL